MVEYPVSIREQLVRDLEVAEWCRQRGLRVPVVLASEPESGRAVIEDLGDADAEATLRCSPESDRSALFERMLQPLVVLAGCDPIELPQWNPPLDEARLRWELAGFELWYVRHFRSRTPTSALDRWLDGLALEVAGHPTRVCHRDYHLNNLILTDGGGVAIIDAQDILIGPDTYDAVSLLGERAAIELITNSERRRLLARWAELTRAEPGWRERADAVRLQRTLKVLGTFARFVVAGRGQYGPWLAGLADTLTEQLAAIDAPADVTAFLID